MRFLGAIDLALGCLDSGGVQCREMVRMGDCMRSRYLQVRPNPSLLGRAYLNFAYENNIAQKGEAACSSAHTISEVGVLLLLGMFFPVVANRSETSSSVSKCISFLTLHSQWFDRIYIDGDARSDTNPQPLMGI